MPDIQTQDGLLDIISLGCVLEFATPLSRTRYADNYDQGTDEACSDYTEESQARSWFRVIMKMFAARYMALIDGRIIHLSYVWHRVMVGFAAALVNHMKAKKGIVKMEPGVTPGTVEKALRVHLSLDHPHLVTPFDAALKSTPAHTSLTWDGPTITIVPKSRTCHQLLRAAGFPEERDLVTWPLRAVGVRGLHETVDKYYKGPWSEEGLGHDQTKQSV